MWYEKFNTVYQEEAGGDGAAGGGTGGDSGGGDSGQGGGSADADAVAAAVGGDNGTGDQGGSESQAWLFADGITGEGDVPEWFKGDKYKSVSEQAKAYTELEGKFGSFTGAPDEYTINISEELTEQGVSIDSEDPIMEEAFKFAKESGMNQEGFDSMLNMYAMAELARESATEEGRTEEIKLLGANANTRLDNLNKWATANLSDDMIEGFQDLATSAEGVKALERLVSMTRNAPVSPDVIKNAPTVSSEEVMKMLFEKDEFGNRRIQTDPDFKDRYTKMRDEAWGSEEHRVVVGG